ncbi:MAG: bifunctional diguanylate cyclase/phosphodiesterase [Actinomycetota bacterium]
MTTTEQDSEAPLVAEIERLHRRLDRERSARREAERIAEEATRSSIEDPLTGLANRTLLAANLQNELTRAARYARDVALFYLDLNRFKLINDTYGHEAGDDILVGVAEALQHTLRASDTVGRLGGDEFMVIAPDIGEPDALRLAGRMATAVEAIKPESTGGLGCRASIGVAMLRGRTDLDPDDFVRQADAAMYAAKTAGAEVRLFDDDLLAAADEKRDLRRALPQAIRSDEFVVHHQPFVALSSRRVVGFEALTRWALDDDGLLMPDVFIPVVEESGLVGDFGDLIARKAMLDLALWQERHDDREAVVAINASPRELTRPGYAYRLALAAEEVGVRPDNVIVEVTETAIMEAGQAADDNLRALRRVGARVALDDFGTGYSSISRLRRNDFDVLKIDRSFVAGVADHRDDRAVVTAIVALADAFGVEVVAEGVETQAQLDAITELGCHAAQGWLFAKAAPIDEVAGPLDFA